jgi:hypothetical protein
MMPRICCTANAEQPALGKPLYFHGRRPDIKEVLQRVIQLLLELFRDTTPLFKPGSSHSDLLGNIVVAVDISQAVPGSRLLHAALGQAIGGANISH